MLLNTLPLEVSRPRMQNGDRRSRAAVLVVSADDAVRAAAAAALREEGFEILEAESTAGAVAIAADAPLDAVVLDVDLPDVDGYELCRRLKAGASGLLPVLQLAGDGADGDARRRGMLVGADGYLAIPFDGDSLRSMVSALVRLKRHEMERLAQAEALDALADHVALLDATGEVIAVNRAWADFAAANGYKGGGTGLGVNYCDLCDACGGDAEAAAAAAGIRQVLAGEVDRFVLDYTCHSPAEQRWFRMTVRAAARPGPAAAIVAHANATQEWLAARAGDAAREVADVVHAAHATDQALLRSLTERSQEFVSILDRNGRFTYVSPSGQRVIGYPAAELVGTFPTALVHPDDLATMLATYESLVAGGPGAVAQMLIRMRHQDGSWRWFEGGGENLLHDPTVRGIMSNARDVTARVQAEHDRDASDARFRRFVETTHEAVIAMDGTGVITYANPRIASLLGYAVEELVGRPFFDFMPPDSAFAMRTRFARLGRGFADAVESCLLHRDGSEIDVMAAESPLVDEHDAVVGVLAMLSDVTARKKAERASESALKAADLDRRRLEATLAAIPIGVWLVDANGGLTHTNPAVDRIWGGPVPHVSSTGEYGVYTARWADSGEPLTADAWALSRTLSTGETIVGDLLEIDRFDGGRAWILNSAAPIRDTSGRLIGAVAVTIDVSDRHALALERERLVASLERERTHLATIFERSTAFLAVGRGPDHVFERVNPAYRELVGQGELVGRSVGDALPGIREQGFVALLDGVRETGVPVVGRQVPVTLVRTAGATPETRYIDIVYQRLEEPDGDHALVAHGVDVTDYVVATQELQRNEDRQREQFAKLPVPTYLWEERGDDFVLLECNEAARAVLPHVGLDAIGQMSRTLFPGMETLVDDVRTSLRENRVVRRSIVIDSCPTGARSFDMTIGPQQPNRVLLHAVDTTERVALEEQLRQTHKMEAIGQLAGGVAHDFNNLLTVIGAHGSFLLETLAVNDPRRRDVEAMAQAGDRAAGLTRQLLAFSRKQLLQPQVLDLNASVAATRTMLARLLGEDITIVAQLAPELPKVLADPTQIDQVLVNLAINGRDAMPGGGRLTITTRLTTVGADMPGAPPNLAPGPFAELEVRDTGTGMDATVQAHLFEPFFTTKEPGRGTGLGLATVHGIVAQSGGFITLESAPGAGSTFHVFLPLARPADVREPARPARAVAGGDETILLVEDERAVGEIAARILRRSGYTVLPATNGEEALALSAAHDGTIHLVVSDAVMPGMGGVEVVRRLQEQRPTIRTLLMSGYSDDEIVRRGILSADMPFLQKPFSLDDLTRAVRSAIDAARA